jgi:hypothetical protein
VLVRIFGFLLAILKNKFLSLIFKVFVEGGLYRLSGHAFQGR